MRIVLIRHAQSSNNVLSEISYDAYTECRSNDATITEQGEKDSIVVGRFLKQNNFLINKFYSSASKRSLTTMDIISSVYNKETPVELFVDIHEYGGVHIGNVGNPGLNENEIKELVPRITIPEGCDVLNGWWKFDIMETEEMLRERVKRVISKLKELAVNNQEDYTVCLVTHQLFLNAFITMLLNAELLIDNLNFGFSNLSISSITISPKKEIAIEFLNFPFKNEKEE